jgi:uncharacterized BrkB/YihY/UPF0761 family membrane protein
MLLIIGIIFAILGSSQLFIAIDKCMTIIYRVPERSFLRQNILALAMLFIFILLIPTMIAASSIPSILISFITSGAGRFGSFIIGILCSLLVAFILFEIIYWVIPNKKMSFQVTWCGAIVAACALEIFIILFPLYIRHFMGSYTGKIDHTKRFSDKGLSLFIKDKLVLLLFFCCSSIILLLFSFWVLKSMPSFLNIINHYLMDWEHM